MKNYEVKSILVMIVITVLIPPVYSQRDSGKPVFPGAGRICGAPRHQLERRQRRPGEGGGLASV